MHDRDVPAAAAAAAPAQPWPRHAVAASQQRWPEHPPHAHANPYPPQRLLPAETQQPHPEQQTQAAHATPRRSTDDSDDASSAGWGVSQLRTDAVQQKQAAAARSHAQAAASSHSFPASSLESYEQELLAVWCQVRTQAAQFQPVMDLRYVNQLADELQAPRLSNPRSHLVTAALEGMAGGVLPAPVPCITTILNLPEHSPASIPKIDLPPLMPPAGRNVRTTSNGSKRVTGAAADVGKKSAKKPNDKPKKKPAPKAKPLSPAVVDAAAAAAAAASDGVMPMVLEEPVVKVELEEEKHESEHESEEEEEDPEPPSDAELSEEEDDYDPNSEEEDDYRPSRRGGAQTKRKGKSRQGAATSKSGSLMKRKTRSLNQDEEADANEGSDAEEEEPSSSDDDEGERNKRRKAGRGTATRVFDSKQRRSKLPLKAVLVLRNYFVAHIDHPFPRDTDKASLAEECGLAFKQISDWFTNTRKRFWRPYADYLEREGCVIAQKGKEFGTCKCGAKGSGGNKKTKKGTAAVAAPAASAASAGSDEESAATAAPRHSWLSMWD